MLIDFSEFGGLCSCGKEHIMFTRVAVIEAGSLFKFDDYMEKFGVTGKRCALYGENCYRATADRHIRAAQEIVLNPEGLHANEIATAEVLSKLHDDIEVIVAVGSGTMHDIARYCAHARGIRFVSCPTAASVDGFCSTVAAMTWYGYKKTMPAVAPEIVIADIDIIKNAPMELVRSGVGDIMAKYTARADWEIANLVAGEYLCPRIRDIMAEAADSVMDAVPGIISGEDSAFEKVTYALIMSGVAMQMIGNSRPASGAEHHISHMIETGPAAFAVKFPALHGEKTGVGSVYVSREYKRLAEIEEITPYLRDYTAFPEEKIRSFFGADLAEAILEENRNDCLSAVTKDKLAEKWPEIRKIISDLKEPEYFIEILEKLGAKRTLEDIGVAEEQLSELLIYSPIIRNRLTLMRMKRMIDI